MNNKIKIIINTLLILIPLLSCNIIANQDFNNIYQNALHVAKKQGESVKISDQAILTIPKNHIFIPRKEAVEISEAYGNFNNEQLQGIIMPSNVYTQNWMIYIAYDKSGYISDEDQEALDPENLLTVIKDATNESNQLRREKGMGELTVERWIENPVYNRQSHQLVWSLLAKEHDLNSGKDYPLVNYKASMLGREGMFSFVLVTDESLIEENKQNMKEVLSNMDYKPGKRYEDFLPGSDKMAEFGLATLVTGIAAKKMGLFALLGVFLVKAGKLLLLIPVLLANRIKKLFGRNKE